MAKKHLGQNFLKSKKAIDTITSKVSGGVVLEIGPGKGAITEVLLQKAETLIAIEKDEELISFLEEKFASYTNFHLIYGDVLEFDVRLIQQYAHSYMVVANIPYYITGAIIRFFLESSFQPSAMYLLIQKEVAERIVSRDGKESILSLAVKAYGVPKIMMKVGREYFTPKPDVDSSIIEISKISKDFFQDFSEQDFFRVVRTAFQFKRKNIANNLKQDFPHVVQVLEKLAISPITRSEDLSLSDFAQLTRELIQK